MNSSTRILFRVGGAIAIVVLGFPLFQGWVRQVEVLLSVRILQVLQLGHRAIAVEHSVVLVPDGQPVFRAVLSPACSSLAAILALSCLAVLTQGHRWPRRIAAIGLAIGAVAVGNTIRVVASLLVGIMSGRGSLVLFHDFAGGAFTFVYIIGGYILLLSVLLRKPDETVVGAAALHHG
ncbi:MAG: exosortase/archaeosortase family protein [Actinomycetia bacterium]|nr:exosortase/archaeosortase family protein [Actinomycetes bacterium]